MASILIVDDEQPMRELLIAIFEDAGHHALPAINGRHALEVLEQERPDLVLSDVMMPVLNGLNLCRRLKAEPSTASIPVILMSAAGHEVADGSAADAYLDKPFELDELEALVRRWLPPATRLG
jgi:CheY-like chemotaxis protein